MLDTTFDPKAAEAKIYAAWEASGAFKPTGTGAPFSIVIPPPNVTGSLHIGHALNNTLQDILARFERMRGKAVLWQPGMDHAGIATQLVVERQLAERQISRHDLGREKFVGTVWAWKEESGGAITRQLRRLGASCDWSRERFTMDEGLSRAVVKVFVNLYRQGLIYKDKRLVNWDPRLQTAVSDLEVENIEEKGKLWFIRYPFADDPAQFITVATTRPETMLGDVAVAVNPQDDRYADLVGKLVRLPLTDRTIPIIADDYSDPEKGTGAVKITPAHDFNDFEIGRRHGLEAIAILDREAKLNDNAPERFRALDRFEARERVLRELEEAELVEKIEEITHAVPYDEKSKTVVIEPMLTEQWYVKTDVLARPAIAAVEDGRVTFTPDNFAHIYFHWMRNIQPWCISRQLWWGHQIPAWYDEDGRVYVAEDEAGAYDEARSANPGEEITLHRDEDVLDTWFSSALWPFSTLGWPDRTPELKRFYPTSVLVTMYDIIFFWVARMMMMGMHFAGEIPFHKVLIHARVVDEKGAKMSKTKGNVVDPLTLIDEYGADALRLTLAMKASPGKDVRMGKSVVEPYRNFGTKLWNAARFCQMNECALWEAFDPKSAKQTINRWIIGALTRTARDVTANIESFRFNDAAAALYHFVYDEFCAWYVELIKPLLAGEDEASKAETRRTAAFVLDQILKLLHPFMPFITEELWGRLAEFGPKRARMLIAEGWPALAEDLIDPAADAEISWVIRLISETRSVRSELGVPAAARISLTLVGASKVEVARLERYQDLIERLARLDYTAHAKTAPEGSVTFVLDGVTAALPLKGVIDFRAEAGRLAKEIRKLDGEIARIDQKLGNANFVERAPAEVIEEQRERRNEFEAAKLKLNAALARVQGQSA